ncbi:LysR family transcriptional regulator [Pseudochrobactrum sp. MP213Fo]|uniref:LysR family transcriptional regulator n=1 Tax=Pseudochrobactrum sp. MP213Fo TaxID=3022250 RepID=UPI003B9DDF8D
MRNLKALEAYLEVATLGSVTAAAKRLQLSQPSVSRIIQDLERDLGQKLFIRAGQRLVLTPQGMLLRDDVERALAGIAEVWDRAQELSDLKSRPVRVASISALAFGLVPHAWASLSNAIGIEGARRIAIQTDTPERVRNSVLSNDADVGATSLPLQHRDQITHWFGCAPCVLAVRSDDPLAQEKGPLPLSVVKSRTLVEMSNHRGLPARIRQTLRTNDIVTGGLIRTNSTMNALALIRAGAGGPAGSVAIIEPVTSAGTPLDGVTILPLEPHIPYCFGVISHNGVHLSDTALQLIAALENAAHELVPGFETHSPDEHQSLITQLALLED